MAKQDTPAVSVVIEGYNEYRSRGTAIDTLKALQRQDFPLNQVEVVLIGNPSQVKTWKTLWSDPEPFHAVRFAELDGHYLQLKNHGAELASADILAFTDSDVDLKPTWLPSLVESIRQGAEVVVGLSLFKASTTWESDLATRLAAASITWGWVIGKTTAPGAQAPEPVGFMDHNVAFRAETFRTHSYRADQGRLLGAPRLYRTLRNAGVRMALQPRQQAVHFFTWPYWLTLHFRYGYEVYLLRRLDGAYPNQWIRWTWILEPVVSMAWHMLLDVPRWFRVSRLLGLSRVRRLTILPILLVCSFAARGTEMIGMIATMLAPDAMKRWAESM